jgi:hypothetical protein
MSGGVTDATPENPRDKNQVITRPAHTIARVFVYMLDQSLLRSV